MFVSAQIRSRSRSRQKERKTKPKPRVTGARGSSGGCRPRRVGVFGAGASRHRRCRRACLGACPGADQGGAACPVPGDCRRGQEVAAGSRQPGRGLQPAADAHDRRPCRRRLRHPHHDFGLSTCRQLGCPLCCCWMPRRSAAAVHLARHCQCGAAGARGAAEHYHRFPAWPPEEVYRAGKRSAAAMMGIAGVHIDSNCFIFKKLWNFS